MPKAGQQRSQHVEYGVVHVYRVGQNDDACGIRPISAARSGNARPFVPRRHTEKSDGPT